MKKTMLILLIALIAGSTVNAQKTVLGTVTYSYKVAGEGAEAMAGMMPTSMTVKYAKDFIAVEMSGGMMTAMLGKTVTDGNTGESFMIKDSEKTIYTISDEDVDASQVDVGDADVTEHSDTKDIYGYKCNKYSLKMTVQGMEMKQIIWATKKLESAEYKHSASMSSMGGFDMMNSKIKGFPMMVEIEIPGSELTMQLTVTDIKFEKIPDSEFAKPEGYAVKPISEMQMF